jgi:MerR family mercuric resistance operon transcriptional regulator
MRIGALAALAGVPTATVRYYERRGLSAAPPRTSGGDRRYGADTAECLRFIKRAQELGFTLQEVEELLALKVTDPHSCAAVEAAARGKIADVERRLVELERLRAALGRLVSACSSRVPTAECPVLEMLSEEENTGA